MKHIDMKHADKKRTNNRLLALAEYEVLVEQNTRANYLLAFLCGAALGLLAAWFV